MIIFMQMMVEMWSDNSIKTLKAVTDCKLLTLNVLGQHLSLLKSRKFRRKQTNPTDIFKVYHDGPWQISRIPLLISGGKALYFCQFREIDCLLNFQ